MRTFTQSGHLDHPHDNDQGRINGGKTVDPSSGPLTVLLVDDDEDLREYLRSCLGQFGPLFGRIYEATTGPDALNEASANRVNLLICGAQVSRMSAETLFSAIRSDESLRSMLIIQVADLNSDIESSAAKGNVLVDAVLASPFNAADFGVCLGQLM